MRAPMRRKNRPLRRLKTKFDSARHFLSSCTSFSTSPTLSGPTATAWISLRQGCCYYLYVRDRATKQPSDMAASTPESPSRRSVSGSVNWSREVAARTEEMEAQIAELEAQSARLVSPTIGSRASPPHGTKDRLHCPSIWPRRSSAAWATGPSCSRRTSTSSSSCATSRVPSSARRTRARRARRAT